LYEADGSRHLAMVIRARSEMVIRYQSLADERIGIRIAPKADLILVP